VRVNTASVHAPRCFGVSSSLNLLFLYFPVPGGCAPAAQSLSFVLPNESNQSKGVGAAELTLRSASAPFRQPPQVSFPGGGCCDLRRSSGVALALCLFCPLARLRERVGVRVNTASAHSPCALAFPIAGTCSSFTSRCRGCAPAAQSLSFVLPNESNQSKGVGAAELTLRSASAPFRQPPQVSFRGGGCCVLRRSSGAALALR